MCAEMYSVASRSCLAFSCEIFLVGSLRKIRNVETTNFMNTQQCLNQDFAQMPSAKFEGGARTKCSRYNSVNNVLVAES